MNKDFLTLQGAGDYLGKSVQTIRRMIKKGDLKAQKVKTPQGFNYVIKSEDLGIQMLSNSPIQNANSAEEGAEKRVLTNQNEIPTNQTELEAHKGANFGAIDKTIERAIGEANVRTGEVERETEVVERETEVVERETEVAERETEEKPDKRDVQNSEIWRGEGKNPFVQIFETQHLEKMRLLNILERLQIELEAERRKPKSFFGYLVDWLLS